MVATEDLTLLLAFWAGILSFFSPCVLPMVPVYVAHLMGSPEVLTGQQYARRAGLTHALSFVFGFSAVFIALGASVGLAGSVLIDRMPLLTRIAGAVVIVLGLHMILSNWMRIPFLSFLSYEKRVEYRGGDSTGYLRSLLLGSGFAIGWTPCVGPILGAIITLAWDSATVWRGAFLLVIYCAGLGVPFIIAGVSLGSMSRLTRRLRPWMPAISVTAGGLLIFIGLLIALDKFALLNNYFDWFGLSAGV